ncbi:MAG: hypothetical protein M1820_003717 [Bogoriella megaspora]|nr:MAG: hypothetical protein M1820_003717 [Bogoriella megaspora]
MPFMRPLRLVLSLLFCVLAITLLLYSTRHYSKPGASIATAKKSGLRALFSFHAPSSLFPPSAIISLTDDNSTFFLARPAAFGPSLPSKGLSGQLWIGSGFGDDSLSRGGIITGAEGELGCSDVPGWTGAEQRFGRSPDLPSRLSWRNSGSRSSYGDNAASEMRRSSKRAQDEAFEIEVVENEETSLKTEDGTDDYLHRPLPDIEISNPNDPTPRKAGRSNTHADIQSLQEAAEIAGKVVLLSRGGCGFLEKVKWVQRREGTALIVGDDVRGGPLVTMYARGDVSNITIPALFTSRMTAHLLAGLVPSGGYLGGFPASDATLPGKTGPNERFIREGKKDANVAMEGQDIDERTFTPAATSASAAKATVGIRGSSRSFEGQIQSDPIQTRRQHRGFIRSLASAVGFGYKDNGENLEKDSRRPPGSGEVDWVMDERKEAGKTIVTSAPEPSNNAKARTSAIRNALSTSTSSAGSRSTSDGFVIGVHDWRDPDLVAVQTAKDDSEKTSVTTTRRASATQSASTSSTGQLRGGNVTPGSGEYKHAQAQLKDTGGIKKTEYQGEADESSDSTDRRFRGDLSGQVGSSVDHFDAISSQNTKSTRPHPAAPNNLNTILQRPGAEDPSSGLWVTLTPTSMSSSPFFDTLLVLVVSPLVTLTVVYALLLLRSRIRRRRWRAPKSVVERLPVRTYQTLPSSTNSSTTPISTPVTATSTTPLLHSSGGRHNRPRPRARTASSIPQTLARAIATEEESQSLPEGQPESSYSQQEKREAGLAEWRRKYGGKQKECVVCLEEYVDGVSRVMSLPCGHEFHEGCITPWLTTRRRTCPICKGDVVRSLQRSESPHSQESRQGRFYDDLAATRDEDDDDDIQEQVVIARNDSPSATLPVGSADDDPDLERGEFDRNR